MAFPTTSRHHLPLLAAGQAQKELSHNEALARIDFLLAPVVEAIGLDVPPANPEPGQGWIIGAAPQYAWQGHAGEIALWTDGGWRFFKNFEGFAAWSRADGHWAMRYGAGWELGLLRGVALHLDGEQVVGARQAGIADPAGGAVVDDVARAGVSAILATLRTHGLISQ